MAISSRFYETVRCNVPYPTQSTSSIQEGLPEENCCTSITISTLVKWNISTIPEMEVIIEHITQSFGKREKDTINCRLNNKRRSLFTEQLDSIRLPKCYNFRKCIWLDDTGTIISRLFVNTMDSKSAILVACDYETDQLNAISFNGDFDIDLFTGKDPVVESENRIPKFMGWKERKVPRPFPYDRIAEDGMIRIIDGREEEIVKVWPDIGRKRCDVYLIKAGSGSCEQIICKLFLPNIFKKSAPSEDCEVPIEQMPEGNIETQLKVIKKYDTVLLSYEAGLLSQKINGVLFLEKDKNMNVVDFFMPGENLHRVQADSVATWISQQLEMRDENGVEIHAACKNHIEVRFDPYNYSPDNKKSNPSKAQQSVHVIIRKKHIWALKFCDALRAFFSGVCAKISNKYDPSVSKTLMKEVALGLPSVTPEGKKSALKAFDAIFNVAGEIHLYIDCDRTAAAAELFSNKDQIAIANTRSDITNVKSLHDMFIEIEEDLKNNPIDTSQVPDFDLSYADKSSYSFDAIKKSFSFVVDVLNTIYGKACSMFQSLNNSLPWPKNQDEEEKNPQQIRPESAENFSQRFRTQLTVWLRSIMNTISLVFRGTLNSISYFRN